ncbi:HAD family hydrolase [Candidatus Woesebacteria bacterium]|nr:HAD family hydrolase [Candidatus Woesebacteria bacterium]
MIQAVLFDVDGTLVNSLDNFLNAYKKVLKYYGFSFSDRKVVNLCFGRKEEVICSDLGIPNKVEEFRAMYFDEVKKAMPKLNLFSDTLETITDLKNKKIKLAIITFAVGWYLEEIFRIFNIKKDFSVALSTDDVINPKPHPEAVYKVCSELRIDPNAALVVGDSKGDILMGKSAGSKTVLYTPEDNMKIYSFKELEEEAKPDFVIKRLSDLASVIGSI